MVLDWIDARFGPVTSLRGRRMNAPEPAYWLFGADLARTPVGSWFSAVGQTGAAGTSVDADEALVRCLGELAERYSALTAPIDGTRRPVDPDLMALLPRCADDEDCPPSLRGRPPDVPVTHAPMTRLTDGAGIDVPAGYAHLAFQAVDEPVVATPISTGLAFDPAVHTAVWRGLCEVAERDAMMLTWWLRRAAPEIDVQSDSAAVPTRLVDRLDRLAAVRLRARFFDITTDFGVPTVFCVLDGDEFPRRIVGACCRTDLGTACAKALDEAVAVRQAVRGPEAFDVVSHTDFAWITELEHHAKLYAHGHLPEAFDFLLARGENPVPFAEIAKRHTSAQPDSWADLVSVAGDLHAAGLTVLWTDVTAPELDGVGRVVKVVVPEMVPLSQWHRARWLATPRLTQGGGGSTAAAFNPYPHPFA